MTERYSWYVWVTHGMSKVDGWCASFEEGHDLLDVWMSNWDASGFGIRLLPAPPNAPSANPEEVRRIMGPGAG